MNFGQVLELVKSGEKIGRKGWNGKGMFVYYVPAATYKAQTEVIKKDLGENIDYAAYLALKGTSNVINTWVPSISDVLAEDWEVVNEQQCHKCYFENHFDTERCFHCDGTIERFK